MIAADMPLLQQSPYFRDLRPEDLALVQRHAHRRDLTVGEIILLKGQPAEALYLVVGGRVRIFLSTTEGREQVLFVAGPGTTFNDAAAFDKGTNLANAQAIDPGTSICVVPVSTLAQLLASSPRMAVSIITGLASRTRQMAAVAENVSLCHTIQRVAKFLEAETTASGTVVVNRQELAIRIGSVREVVSRVLRQLEQSGAITREGTRTLRVNVRVLHAIADPAARSHNVAAC